jgi:hypothetical protein
LEEADMKKRDLYTCVIVVAVAAVPASNAEAEQTYSGAVCMPEVLIDNDDDDPSLFYGGVGAGQVPGVYHAFGVGSSHVICPTSIDHNIGNATWFIRVDDQSSSAGISCVGKVLNGDGDLIVQTPACSSSGSFVGRTTFNCAATAGGYSTVFTHLVECTIPGTSTGLFPGIIRITLN